MSMRFGRISRILEKLSDDVLAGLTGPGSNRKLQQRMEQRSGTVATQPSG